MFECVRQHPMGAVDTILCIDEKRLMGYNRVDIRGGKEKPCVNAIFVYESGGFSI